MCYAYGEREREREIDTYIYIIYTHVCVFIDLSYYIIVLLAGDGVTPYKIQI